MSETFWHRMQSASDRPMPDRSSVRTLQPCLLVGDFAMSDYGHLLVKELEKTHVSPIDAGPKGAHFPRESLPSSLTQPCNVGSNDTWPVRKPSKP